jgi:uncharacterized protein
MTMPDLSVQQILRERRDEILAIAARRGARNVRLFGSQARGSAGTQSDIDFLVELEDGRGLFDLGGLLMDLQELLGRKVDVVTEKSLSPYFRAEVLAHSRPL